MISPDYPLPLSYIVDVNHDCNLQCRMCVKRTMKTPSGQRPKEDFFKIVEALPWAREISHGALGDPFCYSGINDVMMFLADKKIFAPLTTNLTLLTEPMLKALPPNTKFYVSIEGTGHMDAYADANMSLDAVKKNILMVKKLRPDIDITVNHLLLNNNFSEARDLMQFCGSNNIYVTFFYPMFFREETEAELSVFRVPNYEMEMQNLAQLGLTFGTRFKMPMPKPYEKPCHRACNYPIIAYDGTVYPCDYVYQDIEGMHGWVSWYLGEPYPVPQHHYAMGNIYSQSFVEIWNSPKWKSLRQKILTLNAKPKFSDFHAIEPSEPFPHCDKCLARWNICL